MKVSQSDSSKCSPLRQVVVGLMLQTKRDSATGVNHFRKFREFSEMPEHIQLQEDVSRVMMEFVAYLILMATGVQKYDVALQYVTHVKMWHVQARITDAGLPEWPAGESSEMSSFKQQVRKWYKDLDSDEKGARQPTTVGVLDFLVNGENGYGGTYDIESFDGNQMFISDLICLFAGTRKGQLLVPSADPSKWKNKELRGSDILIHQNEIQIRVRSKCNGTERQSHLILRSEVQPIVDKFGPQFDIFDKLTKLKNSLTSQSQLLFRHRDGSPITYNQFWKVISKATKEAGMPAGSVGGHGGRIRMATLQAIQGKKDIYIMGRGHWVSTCWHAYVRLFTIVPNANAVSFRLGDLNIDLRGYPPVSEFRK